MKRASTSGLSIVFEAHELNVLTDPHHLRTILTNLLSNAIKYSSRGLVRIRKRAGAQIPSILLTGDVEIRHGPESTATAVVIAYKPLPYEKLSNIIQETLSSFGHQAPSSTY